MSFTWIPLYEEMARKILEFEDRQAELLALLQKLRAEDLKVIQLNDRDASGKEIPLAEMDPLTFFSSFNRTSSVSGRQMILQRIKKAWNLSAPVPQDFDGIPLANAQNSWAFAYAANRESTDVPILWRVAKEALEKNWRTFDQNLFNEAIGISQMGLARMSMSLFWMKPRAYLSLDKNTRAYFERHGIICVDKTAASYQSWMEKVVAKVGDDFPQISLNAYRENGGQDADDSDLDNVKQTNLWRFVKWMGPLLDALRELGGASNPKLVQQQIQNSLKLPDNILELKNKSGQPRFYNELHWARQYLVWEGLLENKTHGQWALSSKGQETFLDQRQSQQIAEKWAAINKQSNTEDDEPTGADDLRLNDAPTNAPSRRYWTLSAGEGGEMWDEFYQDGISAIGWDDLGDLTKFKNKEEIRLRLLELWPSDSTKKNDAHACWQFANEINVGDVIFAKQGFTKLLGYGVVESDYIFDDKRENYQHVHRVKWYSKGEWEMPKDSRMAMKTLTDITRWPDFVKAIAKMSGLEIGKTILAVKNPSSTEVAYWWLNASPKIWDIRNAKVGVVNTYTTHNEAGNKRQKYKHFTAVKPGDLVLGYVTSPEKEIVALCEITKGLHTSEEGEVIEFKKIEPFKTPVTWAELQSLPELKNCEPIQSNQGSLFTLTEEEYDCIRSMIDDRNLGVKVSNLKPFTNADALDGLFMPETQLDLVLARLKRKKALILQGAPGVGKTFVARRLAYALMGQKDERRVSMVQFHPSYGYEDFIQGYRPARSGGLERRDGVFYEFARLARNDPGRDWFFIIDEINRGNLAKIFGELLMLLEADKRGPEHQVSLTYSDKDERFYLPENLYVIGTMNTADRSLAMVDYALRRRFTFITLDPALDTSAFATWLRDRKATDALITRIRTRIGNLNEVISNERDLGSRFRIGHSFFCPPDGHTPDEAWYREVIAGEIQPLLEEYFDSPERVGKLIAELLA